MTRAACLSASTCAARSVSNAPCIGAGSWELEERHTGIRTVSGHPSCPVRAAHLSSPPAASLAVSRALQETRRAHLPAPPYRRCPAIRLRLKLRCRALYASVVAPSISHSRLHLGTAADDAWNHGVSYWAGGRAGAYCASTPRMACPPGHVQRAGSVTLCA